MAARVRADCDIDAANTAATLCVRRTCERTIAAAQLLATSALPHAPLQDQTPLHVHTPHCFASAANENKLRSCHSLEDFCSGQGEGNARSSQPATTQQPTNNPVNTLPLQPRPFGPINDGKLSAASAVTSCSGSSMRAAGVTEMIQLPPLARALRLSAALCT